MRWFLIAVTVLLSFSLPGHADEAEISPFARSDLIIVRRFAVSPRIIALDPSLGFSLDRRQPGVPPARRAAALARATAFVLADTIAEQLHALGYDAVQSDEAGPETDGRVLIVSGTFQSINEGHRRRFASKDASVAASVEIASQMNGSRPHKRLLRLDSHQAMHNSWSNREPGVKSAARQLGRMIADAVVELARRTD